MSVWNSFKKKINEGWSGADFWDTQENARQRQQFASPTTVQTPSNTGGLQVETAQPQQTITIAKPQPQPQIDLSVAGSNQQRDLILPDGRPLSTIPKTPEDLVNEGLNAGKSWEDISRETTVPLENIKSYSQQTRPNYGVAQIEKPQQSNWNKFRDVLDANTEADKWRRQEGNKTRLPSEEEKTITSENPGNIVSNTVGAIPRMANTLANQAVEVGYTAQQQYATDEYSAATANYTKLVKQKAAPNLIAMAKDRLDKAATRVGNINDMIKFTKENYTEGHGGLFNAGTLYNEEDSNKGDLATGARKIGLGTAEGMLDAYSLGLTSVTGKTIAKQGFKTAIKEGTPIIFKNALVNTAQGGVSTLRQGGTPEDALKAAAVSGTIGTLADIGLASGGAAVNSEVNKGIRFLTKGGEDVADKVPVHIKFDEDLRTAPGIDPTLKKVNIADLKMGADTLGSDLDHNQVRKYTQDILDGKPINPLVVTQEGADTLLQDGKHRLAALQATGQEHAPVVFKNVTKPKVIAPVEQAVGAIPNKTQSIADLMPDLASRQGVTETLDQRLSKQYGVAEDTVRRLRNGYGDESANNILARSSDATNIRDKDAFVISEARKAYGSPNVNIAKPVTQAVEDAPVKIAGAPQPKGQLQQLFDNAPSPEKASPEVARQFIGDVTELATKGTAAIDDLLQKQGSSYEDFSRAIHTANRNGVDPSPEVQELYNKFIKPSVDRARAFTGKETGEQKWYLPQTRAGVEKTENFGGTLVSDLDTSDFGFGKTRTNAIPLEELDHSPDALNRYFTQTSAVPYKTQLAVEAVQKRAAAEGRQITTEQAQKAVETQTNLVKNATEAVTKRGEIESLNFVDDLGKLGEDTGKVRIPITDRVGTLERLGRDTTTVFERIPYTRSDGVTSNLFDGTGLLRYRDADAIATTLHRELFDEAGNYSEDKVRNAIAEDLVSADVQQETKDLLTDNTMKRLRAIAREGGDHMAEEQQLALASVQKNVGREQLSEFLQDHTVVDSDLKKILNYHAQRMLMNEKYAQSVATKVTNAITGTYYRGALGYNPLSAFQNITENKRAIALFGAKDAMVAMKKAVGDMDIAERYGVSETNFGDVLAEHLGKNKKSLGEAFDDKAKTMYMFQKTEKFKDATLLHGLEAKYKAQGLTGTELTRAVVDDFHKYGIKYGQFGSVGYNKSKTGRLLFQFMQFQLKDAQITLSEASKAFKGDTDAVKYLARLGAANIPIYLAMSAAYGATWQYVTGLQSPVQSTPLSKDAGLDEKIVSNIPGGPFVDGLKDLYLGFRSEQRNAENEGRAFNPGGVINNSVKKDAALFVPGGNQLINKTGGFLSDQARGYNEGKDGRARFASSDDPLNEAKGAIFGRYTTDRAREYFGSDGIAGDLPGRGGDQKAPVDARWQAKIDEARKTGNHEEIVRLIDSSRDFQEVKKDAFKDPEVEAAYKAVTKTTLNKDNGKLESDIITPEKWKTINGNKDRKLFKLMGDRQKALTQEFGTPHDPIYDLTDQNQINEILNLRQAYTGDDRERKATLKKEGWYTDFEKKMTDYYNKQDGTDHTENTDFGSTPRAAEYYALSKANPAFSGPKSQTLTDYEAVRDSGNEDARKLFYSTHADELGAEYEKRSQDQLDWTNKMRKIEGAEPISKEVWDNATYGYNDDELSVAKRIAAKNGMYLKSSGGSGSNNPFNYAKSGDFGSKRALNIPSVKIKVAKVKVAKKYAPKTVKIQRNKKTI